jgi:hypothetical protein
LRLIVNNENDKSLLTDLSPGYQYPFKRIGRMNERTAVADIAAAQAPAKVVIDNQNARAEQEFKLLEALSRFEAPAASTAVEFCRISR